MKQLIQFRKKFGQANMTSLVERVSRFTVFLRNNDRQSKPIMDGLIHALGSLPHAARRSITFDRGTEFTDGPYLQAGLGVQTWFCDPQSPWQKGTVENTNRRARRWLSRDVDPVDRRSAAPTALRPSQRHASQVSGLQNALGSVPAEAPGPPSMNRLACSGCKVALRRELTRRCWAAATSIRRLLASPWR
ncbi:hypothetical protein GCM10008965_51560 [Methylorubrum aminovorans]|nr:hypothetical protein GCM10025880_62830 [Methylorubrum aminovorans]GMA80027.1 hypothetical protein GCM10025880_64440 [Methylorubrum aminovorans]